MEPVSEDLVNALKGIVFDCNWQKVGNVSDFKTMKCKRLYSLEEAEEDIIVIRDRKDRFYAMDARCPHEGGPLDLGDIEELADRLVIICPWHLFDFDVSNGVSSTGLKQTTYETRVVDGVLYINTATELSLERPGISKVDHDSKKVEENTATIDKTSSITDSSHLSLCDWAVKILNTADPVEKARLTEEAAEKWLKNEIKEISNSEKTLVVPDEPARQKTLNVVDPGRIRRGKGGTQSSRVALLHSLANIEQWAIDLAWDIIARFFNVQFPDGTKLPNEFFIDFVKVARDEAKHFRLLEIRLKELDSFFGALPVHNGLWESATVTKSNFLSRLAILHMVHEARGLDVHPQTRLRFENNGDDESVKLLDILYEDEITHVAAGIRWFQYTCKKNNLDCIETFHEMVRTYFKGYLKPPFDTSGRTTAGMTEEWYLPLVKPTAIKQ